MAPAEAWQNETFRKQHGNVLFLILIAVVLFAALSFVIAQSSRTGGQSPSAEKSKISGAEVSQYPTQLRAAVARMIINGLEYEQIKFNAPSAFSGLGVDVTEGIFHPSGGGAAYQLASPDVMANGAQGRWYFNPNFELDGIGTSLGASPEGNDFIAFLPGIALGVCTEVNDAADIGATIPITNDYLSAIEQDYDDTDAETIPNETVSLGASASGATELFGHPQGCFRNTAGGVYVYYQVVGER